MIFEFTSLIYIYMVSMTTVHDIPSLLSTALAVITIGTLTGMGLLRGTITNQRELLKDAREEIKDLRAKQDRDAIEKAQLKADHDAMQRIVTGEVHWVALDQLLTEHHDEATEHWETSEGLLRQILDQVTKDRR